MHTSTEGELEAGATSPFLDPAHMNDPYGRLARLRAEDPVHHIATLALWVVLRHDDVKYLFSAADLATPDRSAWEFFQPSPEGSYMRWVEEHSLFALPAAEHARLRRLFSVALTPRAVERYEFQVRETVERFAAPIRSATGIVDLMGRSPIPFPTR